MASANPPKISLRTSIRRLLKLSGCSQVWLYAAMLMAVLNTGLTVISMLSTARFVDAVTASRPGEFFAWLELMVFLFLLTISTEFVAIMDPACDD